MNIFSFYKDGKAFCCLFFLGIFLSFSPVFANKTTWHDISFQQHFVQGTISDGANPLPGVTIAVKGKLKSSTISDFTGQYSLLVSPNDTLVVSFLGFKTAMVAVNGSTKLDIKLRFDTTTLQEVKVNAGYYSVKESERTGSIARITSKDIETQPVTNVLATMQGRMAGVNIVQNTGVPGGSFEIKIRGQNSIRSEGNAPLYVIDGVPYASDPIGSYYTATSFPIPTSPLNSINPDNIESIEVLKDADATSIYGSRGANGVVLITTKKGRKGKMVFNFSAATGAGRVTKFLKLMDTPQYLSMRRQAYLNDGLTSYNSWDYDINGAWDQNRYTNWQKELLGGTAQISDLQGSVSGGSSTTQFLLSASYHTESTVFPGDFLYKKGGGQFNMNHQSEDKKFSLSFSAGLTAQDNNLPSYDLSRDARILAPNAPSLYDANGNLNWENGTFQNPLGNLNSKFEAQTKDLVVNTVLSYEVLPDLLLKSSLGYTSLENTETRIIPSTIFNPAYNVSPSNSVLFLNSTNRSSWIIEPQLNWKKDLGSGKLDVLLGGTFQNQTTGRMVQSGSGFSSNNLIYNLAAATYMQILENNQTLYKYQAFFGRVNYNLKQRYILNLTARRDGSSRFGPGNQFANFGAVGAAWLFSSEKLLGEIPWLSFGKLRSSYGTTGNDQIGDYQFLNTYTTSGLVYGGNIGLQPSRLYNADFGWEVNKKLEMALELGFLQDRISTTLAWYQNRSSNQLVGIPIPGSTGFTLLQANLDATVQNTGVELSLRTLNFTGGPFKWTTSVNLTFPRTALKSFPGLESSPYSQEYRLGQSLNLALLYKLKGVNPQTGIYEFEDVNGDGAITFPDDKQYVADLSPKYYGGIQNQLSYKRLTLDFLFQFNKQMNLISPIGPAGVMSNQPQSLSDSWQQPGDAAPYQLYSTGASSAAVTGDYLFSKSDGTLKDVSYIRLKNISLSYDVPLSLNGAKCKVMLQGQNLLTFTKYRDGDPEFTSYGFLPPLRVITAGVQLTF